MQIYVLNFKSFQVKFILELIMHLTGLLTHSDLPILI